MTSQSTLLEIAPGIWAHSSGALWLPDERVALLADAHLGYGWALRRRGQLGPVQDAGARKKLHGLVTALRPEKLVFLGDMVHAPRPTVPERELIVGVLQELAQLTQLILVKGNHDRGFHRDFAELSMQMISEWRSGDLVAMHGDKMPTEYVGHLVVGHLHPAFGIVDDAGASQKVPVFLSGKRLTVLPAFSPLAAGFDVRCRLPDNLMVHFEETEPCIVAATGTRAVRLGTLSRLRST